MSSSCYDKIHRIGIEIQENHEMKTERKAYILLVLITLLLTSLSCNFTKVMFQSISPTETPVTISTESAGTLATEVSSVISNAQTGESIVLEVTEEQLTSAATTELQASGENRIHNLQIHLRDGKMIITGDVSQGGLTLPLSVSLIFTIDTQGRPHSQVVEGSVGPFSLPDSYLTEITSQLDQALINQLNTDANSLVVDSITIADGRMMVLARKQ
jgi:uncharacterized protein YpmS